jgi:hypothetical protein
MRSPVLCSRSDRIGVIELIYRNWSIFPLLGSVSLLSGCVSGTGSTASQTQIPSDTARPSSDDGPVMQAALAISMGQEGETHFDAEALRTAAQTLDSLGARPDADQQEDLSKRWGEQAMVIDPSTAPPVYRGRALGPSYKKGMVSAVSTVSTEQIFLAGKKASVALVPVSSKPISITISDGQGKNICNRSTSSKPANCHWLPLFTERYRINVQTSARQPVSYYLVSN